MDYFVYILFSETLNKFYIGQTVYVEERLKQHNSGFYNSAFSKVATDWELFWMLECKTRGQALKIERHIKEMRNRDFTKILFAIQKSL